MKKLMFALLACTLLIPFFANANSIGTFLDSITGYATVGECSETDSGRDYFVVGECADSISENEDTCLGNYVREYYCEGDVCARSYYECDAGCENGACLGEITDTSICNDEDGKDLFTAGNCITTRSHKDYCYNGKGKEEIREWYCDGTTCKYENTKCPEGYVCNGYPAKCVKNPLAVGEKCKEGDGGQDYFTASYCYDLSGNNYSDECFGRSLREYTCIRDSYCFKTYKRCDLGCQDGACLGGSTTTTSIHPDMCPEFGQEECRDYDLYVCGNVGGYLDWGISKENTKQCCDDRGCCEDSDGGVDEFTKGVTTGFDLHGKWNELTDLCVDDDQGELFVEENFCHEGYVNTINLAKQPKTIPCAFGCEDGACIMGNTCEDSDFGENIYKRSYVTLDGGRVNYWDSCVEDLDQKTFTVHETYCENGFNKNSAHNCPTKCKDNICDGDSMEDLWYSPSMFELDGNFNGVIVVGSNAPSTDVKAAMDIASGLVHIGIDTSEVGIAKLDTDIESLSQGNMIVVGNPCVNTVTFELLGSPSVCDEGIIAGAGTIKLIIKENNYYLLIIGGDDEILSVATKALIENWNEEGPRFLHGDEWIVTGTLEDYTISLPDKVKECAEVGEKYSKVYNEYPDSCCEGLTEWEQGMDTRRIEDNVCIVTNLLSGNPVGMCLNCGDGTCEGVENVCNCPSDCPPKEITCSLEGGHCADVDACLNGETSFLSEGCPGTSICCIEKLFYDPLDSIETVKGKVSKGAFEKGIVKNSFNTRKEGGFISYPNFVDLTKAGTIEFYVKFNFREGPLLSEKVLFQTQSTRVNGLIPKYVNYIEISKNPISKDINFAGIKLHPQLLNGARWTHVAVAWEDDMSSKLYVGGYLYKEGKLNRHFDETQKIAQVAILGAGITSRGSIGSKAIASFDEFIYTPYAKTEFDVVIDNCVGTGQIGSISLGQECCNESHQKLDYAVGGDSQGCAISKGEFICNNCGDGVCGAGENTCNCEEDCIKTCTDSDGGTTTLIQGETCVGEYCKVDEIKFTCNDCEPTIVEHYCEGTEIKSQNMHCAKGFLYGPNGDCTFYPECEETDYGYNPYMKGTMGQSEDYCSEDGTKVTEFHCDGYGTTLPFVIVDCPNGCEDGACIMESTDRCPVEGQEICRGLNLLTCRSVGNYLDWVLVEENSEKCENTCTDSDGGKDVFVSGYACVGDACQYDSLIFRPGEEPLIQEIFCEDGYVKQTLMSCPEGSSYHKDGFCEEISCDEDDYGFNPYMKGTYRGNTDSCSDNGRTLTEYACCFRQNSLPYETFSCPSGCVDGACRPDLFCEESDDGDDIYNWGEADSGILKLGDLCFAAPEKTYDNRIGETVNVILETPNELGIYPTLSFNLVSVDRMNKAIKIHVEDRDEIISLGDTFHLSGVGITLIEVYTREESIYWPAAIIFASHSGAEHTYLSEIYCEEGQIKSTIAKCEKCRNGACVKDIPPPVCNGCTFNEKCLPIGIRLGDDDKDLYCSFTGELQVEKSSGNECYNNFECLSNICADGKCIDLQDKIDEGAGLLWKVWCRVSNLEDQTGFNRCVESSQ